MIVRLIIATMVLCVTLAAPFTARSEKTYKGEYLELSGHDFKFDGKTVEIAEFISFYCGHCYSFQRWIPVIRGNFPGKVKWRTLPIYWGKGSSKPGEAFLIAEESGKGEEMKAAIFHANFVERKDIGKVELLEELAGKIGLGFNFSMKLRGGDKEKEAREALQMADAYGVRSTPSVVIAGNILTSPTMTNGDLPAFSKNVTSILTGIFKR